MGCFERDGFVAKRWLLRGMNRQRQQGLMLGGNRQLLIEVDDSSHHVEYSTNLTCVIDFVGDELSNATVAFFPSANCMPDN